MKAIFSLLLAASLGSAFAQCTSPYNPDADGNGVIGSSDLMGLLTTFGNPFCGYDSLNVQTITGAGALISENTDIINIGGEADQWLGVSLPSGLETKVLIVFVRPFLDGCCDPRGLAFSYEEGGGYQYAFSHFAYRNSIFNLVRFNGEWFISNPGGEGN